MNRLFVIAVCLLIAIGLIGCSGSEPTRKEPPPATAPTPKKAPPAAAMTLQFGAIDIAHHTGRIEKADIEKLAAVVRREKLDVLAVQGITRYPGVATRVDFVDVFAQSAEMRQAFGETANLNGRVGGNAVFSVLPIRTSTNTHYTEAQGLGFEAALQAIVDCGVRDLVVVSTRLPDKPDPSIETDALSTYTNFWTTYVGQPILVCGNLPHKDVMQPPAAYADGSPGDGKAPRLWFTKDGALTLRGTRTEPTNLGTMLITQIGVFPPVKQ